METSDNSCFLILLGTVALACDMAYGTSYRQNVFTAVDTFDVNAITNTSVALSEHAHTSSLNCSRLCRVNEDCVAVLVNDVTGECRLLKVLPDVTDAAQDTQWKCYSKARCRRWLGYREEAGACFKLYKTRLESPLAGERCAQDGGQLLRIRSPQQQEAVARYLRILGSMNTFKVAGRFNESSGEWTLDDGAPIVYFNWYREQYTPSEKCIGMIRYRGFAWRPIGCNNKHWFLCGMELGG